jgi:hypothetical protein
MNEIAIGLIVAVVGAVGALLYSQVLGLWRKWRAIEVSVEPIVGDYWSLVFAGDMPEASEIEGVVHNAREVFDWLRAHGAVDFRATRLRLTVRGVSDETVVIRNIRAIVKHSPPFSGTRVICQSAGANSATLLGFDLDEQTPAGWEWREEGGCERVGNSPFFELNNVTLTRGEVHEFIIFGYTKKYLARWQLYIDLEIGKHRKSISLSDSEKPFETSGVPDPGFGKTLDWAWYDGARFLPSPPSPQPNSKVKHKSKPSPDNLK